MKKNPSRLAAGLALAAALACLPGRADEVSDDARAQYDRGVELFEEGKFEEAAIAFARAYELAPSYKILFNIGQTEMEAGNYAAALEAYSGYLSGGGDEVPEDRRADVEVEVERLGSLVGRIDVRGGPPGAVVLVDREVKGELPLAEPIPIDLGKRSVVVEKSGAKLLDRVVKVAGGVTVTLEIETAGPEPEPEPEPSPAELDDREAEESPTEEDEGVSQAAFWVVAGVAAAAGIATIAIDFAVVDAYEEAEADPSNEALRDDVTDLQAAEWALLATTAAGLVVSGVLAGFTDWGGSDEGEADVSLGAIGPIAVDKGAGVALQGRFR